MQKKQYIRYLLVLVFGVLLMTGCQSIGTGTTSQVTTRDGIKIHIIDVDQGDSILIQSGEESLLIDAGENNMGDRVVSYLNSVGISTLNYVIGTHPHSDHIGGLDVVINEFQVEKVILPPAEHSTKTYEDVLTAISKKGLKITKPVVGTEYHIGNAIFQIIAPNSEEYNDLNDYSVGIRLVYGDTSYVFAGDADAIAEEEMCNNGLDISADVLKLNHHGSSYSNNKDFIDAVSPTYAVISVGTGNSYGHPHKEVLEDMQQRGIEVYRTDYLGTIVITSDGNDITFQTGSNSVQFNENVSGDTQGAKENSSYEVNDIESVEANDIESYDEETKQDMSMDDSNESKIEKVYVTASGTKYHREGCGYLKGTYSSLSLEEAVEEGYTPCSRCFD